LTLTLNWSSRKSERARMTDRFTYRGQEFRYMTGHEGQDGVCWWCGQSFESKRPRHCCTPDHTDEYRRHFEWQPASAWALKRADHKCQECGKTGREVHHIVRINGGERFYSILNIPCNLIVLCLDCHNKTKRKFKDERQIPLEINA
jgi:5-methylcytosine-specific restriction endonuclease McrA